MTTEELFCKWWVESFARAKPVSQTISTHVAFADYVEQVRTREMLDVLGRGDKQPL